MQELGVQSPALIQPSVMTITGDELSPLAILLLAHTVVVKPLIRRNWIHSPRDRILDDTGCGIQETKLQAEVEVHGILDSRARRRAVRVLPEPKVVRGRLRGHEERAPVRRQRQSVDASPGTPSLAGCVSPEPQRTTILNECVGLSIPGIGFRYGPGDRKSVV